MGLEHIGQLLYLQVSQTHKCIQGENNLQANFDSQIMHLRSFTAIATFSFIFTIRESLEILTANMKFQK